MDNFDDEVGWALYAEWLEKSLNTRYAHPKWEPIDAVIDAGRPQEVVRTDGPQVPKV